MGTRLATLAAVVAFVFTGPAAAETLLIGNKAENTVSFVELATGKERARVETGPSPHEIAISPDRKQAAVVAYGGATGDTFDVATATMVKRFDLAPNAAPHGIAWLRDGRIVTAAEMSQSLVIVDVGGKAMRTVLTGQDGSHMVAVSPDQRRVYVANVRSGTISVIDLRREKKLHDIAVGGIPPKGWR